MEPESAAHIAPPLLGPIKKRLSRNGKIKA